MNFIFLAATPPADAAASGGGFAGLLPILVMIPLMYFFLIRPQRKREKEAQKMRSGIEIGDEVVTMGGIIGLVVNIRDDSIVIETGSDRSKIRIERWAVQTNRTAHDDSSRGK